ncbi:S41 family peptidase [Mongoliibacter ruber]|uniref:PDZ domain-containing protein n=1 Tax=Mongoliibacter ruber TaxID=1750599 RepID=A0A2T0WJY0_9BACT|nr:S41 family peptidase [Mongoliibacter ruber]PRY87020.1 PDZ domain-containing protein [Mongoliibacter ruber]
MKNSIKLILNFIIVAFIAFACQEKEDPVDVDDEIVVSKNGEINQWIQRLMDQGYYWLEDMKNPIDINSDPEDYFEALLFRPTDRYSEIFPNYDVIANSLQGIRRQAGYEFLLARESQNNENVLAFISYVKNGSPAKDAGLRRGDVITQINGSTLNLSNFQTLLRTISDSHTLSYLRFNEEEDQYEPQPEVSLQTIQLSENPNFLDTIYTVENQKIGYVVYHFFARGIPGQEDRYDNQMDEIFAKFKSEGINSLILDFRYNGGGSLASTLNLASLIAPNVTTQDVFLEQKYNSFLSQFEEFQDDKLEFLSKSQNLGPILNGNRVYILTSGRTASASEMIINGLKPYMDVKLIGTTTEGKNVGSALLQDTENSENDYGMLPIITMLFNSNGESDFIEGFEPDIEAIELTQRFLAPLGDTREYMLSLALQDITGVSSVNARRGQEQRIPLGDSFEKKAFTGKIIYENFEFPQK